MIALTDQPRMTPEAYLLWEAGQELRYEYIEGEVFAITGGTIPHNDIALNLYRALYPHLRAKDCRINVADAKLGITTTGPFLYPDLLVTCDARDRRAIEFVQFPCLLVEVLSPSTEAYNRGGKFAQYRRLESLREYALISSDSISVDIFRLNDRGKWELTPYCEGETLQLASIDFECPIELLYEDIKFLRQSVNETADGV
jgi:Uma2 family endonuclease